MNTPGSIQRGKHALEQKRTIAQYIWPPRQPRQCECWNIIFCFENVFHQWKKSSSLWGRWEFRYSDPQDGETISQRVPWGEILFWNSTPPPVVGPSPKKHHTFIRLWGLLFIPAYGRHTISRLVHVLSFRYPLSPHLGLVFVFSVFLYFTSAPTLALGGTIWRFNRWLNFARKRFNSIFDSKENCQDSIQ